jgi:hypothetical protein
LGESVNAAAGLEATLSEFPPFICSEPSARESRYTSNHDLIASKETGAFKAFVLHAVDAVGIVHAMLLRIQALVLPIKTLGLTGH